MQNRKRSRVRIKIIINPNSLKTFNLILIIVKKMIPGTISWEYKNLDINNGAIHSVCCKCFIAERDIPLKEFIPEELENFMMFTCVITRDREVNRDIIQCVLIVDETVDLQFIQKGSYYVTYLIPTRHKVDSSSLKITDIFKDELWIELKYSYIFNCAYCTKAYLPNNTFIFN